MDLQAKPKFCKARPVPYAYCDKVDKEIERLVCLGIMEPIQNAEWAAPIVSVLNKDDHRSICICGDFKCTINSA